jgi:SNF2 family DNA or RNA helicase
LILITVKPTQPGWNDLVFRYAPDVIAVLKEVPGCRWVPERKVWRAPDHALGTLYRLLAPLARFNLAAVPPRAEPALMFSHRLRPYQVEGATRFMRALGSGYLLSFDMRTGKTIVGAAAAASYLAQNFARTVVLLYPAVAKAEWQRQFKEQTGLDVVVFEGTTEFDPNGPELAYLKGLQHLAVGIHYELIRDGGDEDEGRAGELLRLAEARGPFVLVSDETQYLKNPKVGRTKMALRMARSNLCVARLALTGTPQRNYPRDLWSTFDFIQPDSMGSRSKFGKRYCGAHQGDYGWVDDGDTNSEELAERLAACSMRVTRRDAAPWLPKTERRIVLCDMDKKTAGIYAKQEAALGSAALKAMADANSIASLAALKQLVKLSTPAKLKVMMERIHEHTVLRGVKALVFANFHETLDEAHTLYENSMTAGVTPPPFLAGGWMTPDRRQKAIAQWKACPGPAVLFANILSSGVGIDLSQADTAIFVELTWVPADLMQAEARISDVHQGTRSTPPMLEFLLTRGTVDENMGMALVEKLRSIERIVGGDAETGGLSDAIENGGLVNQNNLSLKSEAPDVVEDVLSKLRERLLGDDTPDESVMTTQQSDNNDMEEDDGDEAEEDGEEADGD